MTPDVRWHVAWLAAHVADLRERRAALAAVCEKVKDKKETTNDEA